MWQIFGLPEAKLLGEKCFQHVNNFKLIMTRIVYILPSGRPGQLQADPDDSAIWKSGHRAEISGVVKSSTTKRGLSYCSQPISRRGHHLERRSASLKPFKRTSK
jgi:hypothetical protein